jgi:hypothetical protein
MALQHIHNSRMGFTAPEAYTRIAQFIGTKEGIRATVETNFNAAARSNGQQPIAVEMIQLSIADGATMTTMYSALKALPQFAGAIDA